MHTALTLAFLEEQSEKLHQDSRDGAATRYFWEAGFNIYIFGFLQVLQELLCQKG